MQTNYEKGRAAEYAIVRTLRGLGFVSERTAGSHGPYDVHGVRSDCAVYVQSKRGGKPSPSEYQSLVDMPVPPGALKIVLWFPAGMVAARILYCADHAGIISAPDWCGMVRWLSEPLPKQPSLRLRTEAPRSLPLK